MSACQRAPFVCAAVAWGLSGQGAGAQDGAITGIVSARDGSGVPDACILLCDDASGMPLLAEGYRVLDAADQRDRSEEGLPRLAWTSSDGAGRFSFARVPDGAYRLIAQRWERPETVGGPLDVNGAELHLFGAADGIVVKDGAAPGVELEPAGDLILTVHVESGNNDTLLVVSRRPTRADPILGFAGWIGPFLEDAVAYNRMPLGETTIRGLPAATVHVGVFANDNNPGWGAAQVELRPATRTRVDIPFVAGWSDGVHSPPPALHPLVDRLVELKLSNPQAILALLGPQGITIEGGNSLIAMMAAVAEHLEQTVTLPDGTDHRAADVLAAAGYAGMRELIRRRGVEPNPYRLPRIQRRPVD